MTPRRWMLITIIVVFVGSGLVGYWTLKGVDAKRESIEAKAQKLDQFCLGTRLSLDTAIRALEGDDVQAREVNARLISDEVFRYGFMSVELCLGAKIPETVDGWTLCQLDKNYACIAKQARAYRDALIKGGF